MAPTMTRTRKTLVVWCAVAAAYFVVFAILTHPAPAAIGALALGIVGAAVIVVLGWILRPPKS